MFCEFESVEVIVIGKFMFIGCLMLFFYGEIVVDFFMEFFYGGCFLIIWDVVYMLVEEKEFVVDLNVVLFFLVNDILLNIFGLLNVVSKEWVIC